MVATNATKGQKRFNFEIAPMDYLSAERFAEQHSTAYSYLAFTILTQTIRPCLQSMTGLLRCLSFPISSFLCLMKKDLRSCRLTKESQLEEEQINITHSPNTLHNYGNRIYSNTATKIHQQFGPSPSPGNKIVGVLDELTLHYPELRKHLRDADGSIPSFINIFVNEDDIRTLEQEQTLVKENAVISIVPAIAGGIKHPAE